MSATANALYSTGHIILSCLDSTDGCLFMLYMFAETCLRMNVKNRNHVRKQLLFGFLDSWWWNLDVGGFMASKGWVEGLEYYCTVSNNVCELLANCATAYGQLGCLKYLVSIGAYLDTDITLYAIKYGMVECLEYLYECTGKIHRDATILAAKYDHANCIKYLYGIRFADVLDPINLYMAIQKGSLNCVRVLVHLGCRCEDEVYLMTNREYNMGRNITLSVYEVTEMNYADFYQCLGIICVGWMECPMSLPASEPVIDWWVESY